MQYVMYISYSLCFFLDVLHNSVAWSDNVIDWLEPGYVEGCLFVFMMFTWLWKIQKIF